MAVEACKYGNGFVGAEEEEDRVKLFVGQVPREMSEEQVMAIFQEAGEIHELSIIRDKATKQPRGCCFVIYKSKRDADKAIALLHDKRKLPPMQSPLQVKYADGELERLEHKLFVGGLPKTATEADIIAVFSKYGPIKEVVIIKSEQASKGCAFVKFEKKHQATMAIQALNGVYRMEGSPSPLLVKWADTDKERKARKAHKSQGALTTGVSPVPVPVQSPSVFGTVPSRYGIATPLSGYGYQAENPYGVSPYPFSAHLNQQNVPTAVNTAGSVPAGGLGYSLPSGTGSVAPSTYTSMQPSPSGYMGSSAYTSFPSAFQANLPGHTGLAPPYQTPSASGIGLAQTFSEAPVPRSAAGSQVEGPRGANLFIYHIPPQFGDEDLLSTFATFGNVISAKVNVDKNTGVSKCFGFVSYTSPEAAQAAISAMNGTQIGGKRLKVQLKRDDIDSKPY